jgi:hypothetical protein
MNASDKDPAVEAGRRHGSRLMLVLADGCRVCLGLDSVEGVYEVAGAGTEIALPDATTVPVVSWAEITGVAPPAEARAPAQVVIVRTRGSRIGLAAEACLGVRDAAFGTTPVLPTRLTDGSGEVLCFVHVIDRRPHFILDPRALDAVVRRRARDTAGNGAHPPAGHEQGGAFAATDAHA